MSVKVELGELAATMADFDVAYLVTVSDEARSHVLSVWPELDRRRPLRRRRRPPHAGQRGAHPDVTLVFPPAEAGGYTLLVDGTATVDGSTVTIAPAKAILHRPAAGPDGRRAGSDCVDVRATTT